MGCTEFIYVFMSKKMIEKGRNRTKLYFMSGFICQHSRKNIWKIEFYNLNSRFSIFGVYWI